MTLKNLRKTAKKRSKIWNNLEKTVKNLKKPGKTVKNIKKLSKMSKNAEKTIKNLKKPGKSHQKYRKIVKNVNKR